MNNEKQLVAVWVIIENGSLKIIKDVTNNINLGNFEFKENECEYQVYSAIKYGDNYELFKN